MAVDEPRLGALWIDLQRFLRFRQRLVESAGGRVEPAHLQVARGEARVELHGPVVSGFRIRQLATPLENPAQHGLDSRRAR